MLFTLNLQVECDLIRAPVVARHTAVVPRILGFHRPNNETAVAMDTASSIHQNRGRGSIGAERKTERERKRERKKREKNREQEKESERDVEIWVLETRKPKIRRLNMIYQYPSPIF